MGACLAGLETVEIMEGVGGDENQPPLNLKGWRMETMSFFFFFFFFSFSKRIRCQIQHLQILGFIFLEIDGSNDQKRVLAILRSIYKLPHSASGMGASTYLRSSDSSKLVAFALGFASAPGRCSKSELRDNAIGWSFDSRRMSAVRRDMKPPTLTLPLHLDAQFADCGPLVDPACWIFICCDWIH